MNALGAHGGAILAAYAVTAVAVALLIARAVIDWRVQNAALARLEAAGVARRPAQAGAPEGAGAGLRA